MHSIMSFVDDIKPVIKLCHLFGLAPYSRLTRTTKWTKSRPHETVTIAYLIIIAAIFAMCIIFNSAIVDHSESGVVVAICIYSLVMICSQSFIILCETLQKRYQYIELLNLFAKFESSLKQRQNIRMNGIRLQRIQRRAILFWILETFGLFTMSISLWLRSRDLDDMFFFLTYTLPHLISKLRFVFWIILIIILQENVNALRKYAESFIVDDINHDFKFFRRECRRSNAQRSNQIERLKRYYAMIWKASILINDIVRWSIPLGFLNEFSVLVFNCYFTIQMLQLPTLPLVSFMYISTWAAMNLINVFFVTSMCENTVHAVSLCQVKP